MEIPCKGTHADATDSDEVDAMDVCKAHFFIFSRKGAKALFIFIFFVMMTKEASISFRFFAIA
jgi:hypothetical protein